VLDLSSLERFTDTELVSAVDYLRQDRPALQIILLSPHVHPEMEIRAAHALRRVGGTALMTQDDVLRVERWKELLRNSFVELHAAMIEADLLTQSPAAAVLFDNPEMAVLLRLAANTMRVGDLGAHQQRHRTNVYRKFLRCWGRSPNDMLTTPRFSPRLSPATSAATCSARSA
jgi:hypothetical protein